MKKEKFVWVSIMAQEDAIDCICDIFESEEEARDYMEEYLVDSFGRDWKYAAPAYGNTVIDREDFFGIEDAFFVKKFPVKEKKIYKIF